MTRFGPTQLQEQVDRINEWLEIDHIPHRFESSPRNGYQAVDLYRVNHEGERIGSGIERNVGCGTSREVYTHCLEEYAAIHRHYSNS